MAMDVVDYEIKGAEMQFVEIELDPGEAAIGEAGSMFFMDAAISMDAVFGDGSANQGGFFGKLLGAGKRLLTGESLFTTIYTNQGSGKQRVAFAAPYPGKIIAMDLAKLGGTLICQKDAFLCAARGVSLGIAFQQKLSTGFFGGEGLFLAKLTGPGEVWLQSLPFSRLASRIFAAAPQMGGHKEEGSLLGGLAGGGLLGGVLGGDDE
ncbi:MAG: AIM24 family protein [Proteobacteria bacterium]|nr:AIM24 family protein [Pseudomonadota bacterium]